MITLLIADDEAFIRQGIRTIIPWADHEIEVIGEASNGKEALNLSIRLKPDIVLADIQMPVMNGLELARQLNSLLPETRVIILSAYGNTENFTHAIEAKVSRFVLKNADSAAILNNVLEVKQEILNSRESYTNYLDLNNIYTENQFLIKSTLLSRYLSRQLSVRDFTAKAEKLGMDFSGPCYAMMLAECSASNDWLTINAFKKTFSRFRPFAFFITDYQLVLVLNCNPQEITAKLMDAVLPELKPYVQGNQLVVLNQIDSFMEFPIAFDSLNNCLDYCFWNTDDEYTLITPAYHLHGEAGARNLNQYEKAIISALLSGNMTSLDVAASHYYDYCREQLIPRSLFLESINRLMLLISAITSEETDIGQLTSYVLELETPAEIMEALTSLVKPKSSSRVQMPQVMEALSYIDQHYDQDLRLEDVAREICLSVGYLSRIFKQETGYSFKEWINRVRIEKAKELITTTDLKYYEIAERVGYKDYKYFAAYFNKFCGCSAKEFKFQKHGPSLQD